MVELTISQANAAAEYTHVVNMELSVLEHLGHVQTAGLNALFCLVVLFFVL